VPEAGVPLTRLMLRTLRTVDLSLATILDPLRLAGSVPEAWVRLGAWRPDVVYTTGGYVAIPALAAAAAWRVPSLLWEGNRRAGRSVRATARLATLRATAFPGTCADLPGPCVTTGTPIRPLGGRDRADARAALGIPPGPPVLLVFGGSQAVRRLNDAVAGALPRLLARCAVVHLAGDAGIGAAEAAAAALPADLRPRYRPFAFLGAEMTDALVAADLIVGRAGSSTLAEAAAAGVPLVVVPYPHAAAHQEANARELADAGAARIVADAAFDADALIDAAAILDDPALHARMAAAARAVGRPGAADATALLLARLAARAPLPSAEELDACVRGQA